MPSESDFIALIKNRYGFAFFLVIAYLGYLKYNTQIRSFFLANFSLNPSWEERIRNKLIGIFAEKDHETLARILFYLDEQEKKYNGDWANIPACKSLKSALNKDKLFKEYANRLAEDTKKADNNKHFSEKMDSVCMQMMKAPKDTSSEAEGFDRARRIDHRVIQQSGFNGLAKAWSQIPQSAQVRILELVPSFIMNKQIVGAVDKVIAKVTKSGSVVIMVTLAAIYLSSDAIKNLYRWWNNEITGKRCAQSILDAVFTIGAGAAGGMGGAAVGSIFGPIGGLAGGVIGGILSTAAMNALRDRLTESLFGIPKEESLENAYNFLGVSMWATNDEINTAFKKRCLKYHPDKPGGTKEDFNFLQLNMGVIKAARGQL